MYAGDNDDMLVLNPGIPTMVDPTKAWVVGDMQNPADAVNQNYIRAGLLFPYAKSVELYKCPGNKMKNMLRGVSMNAYMGGPGFAGYRSFNKMSTITKPSRFFVVMDEDDKTINDAMFRTDGQALTGSSLRINDWPAYYHAGSGGISFADGHAELHKWKNITQGAPAGFNPATGTTITAPIDKPYLLRISTEPVDGSW